MMSVALRFIFVLLFNLLGQVVTNGQDEVFSGPQVGEKLVPFTVRGVFDEEVGKDLDWVTQAGGKPLVLIFVHEVNRQSIALTRTLSDYTKSRAKDGLTTGVVLLDDDATAAENQLKRIRHALAPGVSTGVSLEGREGPGSYGLNRNVTLTVLVGKENRVTGNFALVQPSLQVDLPKILTSVVEVAGGEVPKLEELPGMREAMRNQPATGNADLNLRPLLAPLIRRTASPEDVDRAAQAVEERAAQDAAVRREVGRIANTIISAGKLKDYGTPRAQEYLTKWAAEYGPKTPENSDKESTGPSRPGGLR
jgi:hypothetical protein